jgi:hypothetical protein
MKGVVKGVAIASRKPSRMATAKTQKDDSAIRSR